MENKRSIFEALCQRKSVRSYKKESIPKEIFHRILRFQKEAQALYPEIRVEWQIINAIEGKCPVKGMFLVKAPYYMVLHSEEVPGAAANAGFLMQQMVIFLLQRNIGCCYQGAASVPELGDGTRPVLVMAFGYAGEDLFREEKQAKRKPMSTLCTWKEEGDAAARSLVKAAILSPSAMNLQPWRFAYSKGTLHMFVKKRELFDRFSADMTPIDCGIAMANVSMAAEELWLESRWTEDELLLEKEFAGLEYVASLHIHEK